MKTKHRRVPLGVRARRAFQLRGNLTAWELADELRISNTLAQRLIDDLVIAQRIRLADSRPSFLEKRGELSRRNHLAYEAA